MTADEDAVRSALTATTLAGRPTRSWPVPGTASSIVTVACTHDEIFEAWRAGRSVVDTTGRWPVVIASWSGAEVDAEALGLTQRHGYESAGEGHLALFGAQPLRDTSPGAVLARAAHLSVDDAVASLRRTDLRPPAEAVRDLLDHHLAWTRYTSGTAPEPTEVLDGVGAQASEETLDRWLYEWELQRSGGGPPAHLLRRMTWLDPRRPCAVAFLPVRNGWQAPAYLSYWGADQAGHEELCVLLREWQRRYAAELVANWGTMLQLVVARPPADPEDAWQLAVQISFFARSMQSTVRGIAFEVMATDRWLLHDRP